VRQLGVQSLQHDLAAAQELFSALTFSALALDRLTRVAQFSSDDRRGDSLCLTRNGKLVAKVVGSMAASS